MNKLREAAQAVVDRWDTPLWKDVPATAEYINRLRDALAEPEPVAWMTYDRNETPMVWTNREEACLYCDDEAPIPLYIKSPDTCFDAGDMADAQAKAFREGWAKGDSAL